MLLHVSSSEYVDVVYETEKHILVSLLHVSVFAYAGNPDPVRTTSDQLSSTLPRREGDRKEGTNGICVQYM